MKKNNLQIHCENCEIRLKSIFCGLTKEELEVINEQKGCSNFRKGQIVFNQGAFPHGLYVLNSGKIKIFCLSDNGREQIVRMAKIGDIVGYRSLLNFEKYTSSAETIEESSLCYIPKDVFFSLMEKNSSVTSNLMKLLATDLKNAEHKIIDLVQKPARERMAEALLFVKATYGLENDNATINAILTREELGNISGIATETAIRLLSELKQEKIITFIGKKIKIVDLQKLISTANIND